MRAREFIMKDGYSFDLDEDAFEAAYAAMHACYSAILTRIDSTTAPWKPIRA